MATIGTLRLVIGFSACPAGGVLALLAFVHAAHAQAGPASCSGYSVCPEVDYTTLLQTSADARRVDAGVNSMEAALLHRAAQGGVGGAQARTLLGELIVFDKTLSVGRNVACASCHTANAGFNGGISSLNDENVGFPGSITERSNQRRPITYAYAPFSPVLHYRASTGDFVGGTFWDDHATGLVTGNPAADQALDPPLDPTEMAMSDPACVVFRIYSGQYSGLFQQVWGSGVFAITWPANTDTLCNTPLSTNAPNPTVLDLSAADRQLATSDYHDMGMSVATFEASRESSAFSSKFDAYQAGRASLTPIEQRGFALFTGQGKCDLCHTATGPGPLFTDHTAVNLGVPRNNDLAFLYENLPDVLGFVANPMGPGAPDNGLGAFLAGPLNPNPEWKKLAPKFIGTFQVATIRNVARKPYATFTKAYMHNGYFKTLQDVVHFYNTRDVLPRCVGDPQIGQDGAGTTCWPAPEQPANENMTQLGNLGLSAADEMAIVAFMQTLTDGYQAGAAIGGSK